MKAGLKTFVVDDESVIAKTLEIILMQSGFEADSLTNPVLALESKV
jgi:DNA-binding response OmpR family regulator